jgi:hypothetical protein
VTLSLLGELALRFLPEGQRARAERQGALSGPPTHQTRDFTIAVCAESFDVLSYVPGGVAGLHDLIVLRRP